MNWKDKLDRDILEKGLELYSFNKVALIAEMDTTYKLMVSGVSAYYMVEIDVTEDDITYIECSCNVAKAGKYCQHMAACLYYLEYDTNAFKKMDKGLGKKIKPFAPSIGEYVYFDLGKILRDLEVEEELFENARRLIEEKQVLLNNVMTYYGRSLDHDLYCRAEGTVLQNGTERSLYCVFDNVDIYDAKCNYLNCFGIYQTTVTYSYYRSLDKKICEHLLAFFLLVEEYLKRVNPGDATDIGGERFLANFRMMQGIQDMPENNDIEYDLKLQPVLEQEYYGVYLKVRAGTEKMLLLKSIPDFIEQYEKKGVITLGKNYNIDFEKHHLAKDMEAFYEFIRKIYADSRERRNFMQLRGRYFYEETEADNMIYLYGERVDQFFELFYPGPVSYTDKTKKKTVKKECVLQEKKPTITLTIHTDIDEDDVFQGIVVTGKLPDFIKGNQGLYYFSQTGFNKVNSETQKAIMSLYDVENHGEIYFNVGRRNLSEFYHEVYPKLKKFVRINEPDKDDILAFIPEEAEFTFYLDLDDQLHRILCRPVARYGENEVSLLDNFRDNFPYQMYRNLVKERDILRKLYRYFQVYNLEQDELFSEAWEETAVSLLDGGLEYMMNYGEVHTTERFRKMNIRKMPKIKIGVSVNSDMMNLSVTSDDIDNEELLLILKSYDRKKKYYRLKSGDLATVNDADMEMLKGLLETMHLTDKEFLKGNMKIPIYRALYLNKILEESEHIYLNRDKHFKNLIKEFKTIEDCEEEVPDSLSRIMRSYQVQGFKWMKTLENYEFGGILADDMGLGKTLQAISVLLSDKEKTNNSQTGRGDLSGTSLVVSPASLVYNWKEELAKYAPGLKVSLVTGTQNERTSIIHNYKESDVLVTSYDLLKRDIAEYEGVEFNYQILDEAQYIKNHTTAAAKSAKAIKSRHRLALTGTPIENRLSELWSIFDYLMPGFLYGYDTFRKDMETPIVKNKDENVSERLKKMVSPFILRRLKSSVLMDLPDKLEEVRYAKLEGEQQKLYDGQVVNMKKLLASQKDEDFKKNKLQVLAELTKIRQICCDPSLLFEKYKGESSKKEACIELIQSAIEGEHKILVFSQFTSMLELLEKELNKLKISYYKITGETKKEKRLEMVNDFNNDDTQVFLISLKAGGTGLNLTGADVVIHYDPWWNQAVQNQATDRAHRIGQTKKVTVYKLIAKGTIEEKIVKMQETKKDLADAILSGDNGGLTGMSREDLLELLV